MDGKGSVCIFFFVSFFFLFSFFGLFRAAPEAYGGSQASGPIRAVAAGLHHKIRATQDPSQVSELHYKTLSNTGSLTH